MSDTSETDIAARLQRQGLVDGLPIASGAAITALPGHASTRRYFRVHDGGPSRVLAVYPEGSQEALQRYLRASDWIAAAGVRVPRVEAANRRAILLEDAGHCLLVDGPCEPERRRLYRQAMRVLSRIERHGKATAPPNPDWALDTARLRLELAFAEKHALGSWMGGGGDSTRRAACFDRLASLVGSLPRVVCHRDYHARNLMVRDERLIVIDFQDVMSGPLFYDAASLLWDNYCDLDARTVTELLAGYCRNDAVRRMSSIAGFGVPARPRGLPPAARQAFALVAAQRHIKALGTFGYQVAEAGNSSFAEFGARTWGHVREALRGLEWVEFERALAPFDRLSA